ncbi:SCP2 [Symbiodinium natans]|uniref:SCP2 protein n=1 Tax=Symbiodinium natans TaxID=878477 RepID=A0A812J1W9_9DINO|nr:SCP2 [Symbiodinium natans]
MKSQALFDAMSAAVKAKGPELVKLGGAVFQFVISDAGPEGKFVLDLKNGSGSAKAGEESSADCTIIMADADLVSMAEGKLDGMQAFMGGKLKIKGNMMLAQKLASILEAAK